ncbi:MAG: helix-hairpin-helix domain-containing protein [Verrucomicrobiota bacterium]
MNWLTSWFGSSAIRPILHPDRSCPECGSRLAASPGTETWGCPNPDCPAQIRAQIALWCSPQAMDIPGFDAHRIEQLIARGLVRDVAELYKLRHKELASLPGIDEGAARALLDAIVVSRNREEWRILAGLGIPGIGPNEAQSLCNHFGSLDRVLAASAERYRLAPGLAEESAQNLAKWLDDPVNRRLLKRLLKAR